jgi:hypothetical protein
MNTAISNGYARLIQSQPQISDRAQLRTNDAGQLGSVTRSGFGRMVSAIFRKAADQEHNVAAARSYLEHVRDTHGVDAMVFAEGQLSRRLDQGKPVSMRKIREIESKWQRASGQLHLNKDQLRIGNELGGGAQSKVYLARYEGEQGTLVGVLKPVARGASAGILVKDDQYLADFEANQATASTQVIERNLATCRLAEQIGCRVAAGSFAAEMPDGTPALFMERVHGHEARAIKAPIDSADLRKGLVGLQLLDLLSAQVDRNRSNIMLKTEGGRHLPVAIDHDTSFVTARSASELSGLLNHDTVGLSLPTVVDTSMRDRVLAMTRNDLTTIMGPLADSAKRLEAAVSRLTEMQDHLRAGPPAGLVVEPDGWDSAAVKDRLAADPGNYWHFLTQVARGGD